MTDMLLAMHERRPDWLVAHIAEEFQHQASGRDDKDYGLFGLGQTYDHGLFHGYPVGDVILAEAEEAIGERPAVLDLGAGLGGVIWRLQRMGYDVQGISGIDYSKTAFGHRDAAVRANAHIPGELTPERYLVGDVHNLDRVKGLHLPVGVIFSRTLFQHLVDPLSVLEQAINAVRPGGKIAIDQVPLHRYRPGLARVLPDFTAPIVEAWLVERGLRCARMRSPHSDYEKIFLNGLVIHKDEDIGSLRLPVDYEHDPDQKTWHYTPL